MKQLNKLLSIDNEHNICKWSTKMSPDNDCYDLERYGRYRDAYYLNPNSCNELPESLSSWEHVIKLKCYTALVGEYKSLYSFMYEIKRQEDDIERQIDYSDDDDVIDERMNNTPVRKYFARYEGWNKSCNINKDNDVYKWDLVVAKWLLISDPIRHFQMKLGEINNIRNYISSQTIRLRKKIECLSEENRQNEPRGLLAMIFANSQKNISKRTKIKHNNVEIDINKQMIANYENSIHNSDIALQAVQNAIKYLNSTMPAIRKKADEIDKSVQQISQDCNDFFAEVYKEFSPILDLRDWENLDLIIYFLETHRAETLKEALQQVDMEKRTDKIVKTIKAAADKICLTLEIGFSSINHTIQECSNIIEQRLIEQNRLIIEQNDRVSEQTQAIYKLVSAANISNALHAKQLSTSKKLVEGLNTVRKKMKSTRCI